MEITFTVTTNERMLIRLLLFSLLFQFLFRKLQRLEEDLWISAFCIESRYSRVKQDCGKQTRLRWCCAVWRTSRRVYVQLPPDTATSHSTRPSNRRIYCRAHRQCRVFASIQPVYADWIYWHRCTNWAVRIWSNRLHQLQSVQFDAEEFWKTFPSRSRCTRNSQTPGKTEMKSIICYLAFVYFKKWSITL